jgi:hypothetical protein
MTREYHYSMGGSNTAVYAHGLFKKGDGVCLGVAWWLPPTRSCAEATFPDVDFRSVLNLSRLVVLPEVPLNGASFLLAGSIGLIRDAGKYSCLITYADTWRGHTGQIYKATNWEYVGLTKPLDVWQDIKGHLVCRKMGPKTRTVQQMKDAGCILVGSFPKHKYRMKLTTTKRRYSLLDYCGGDSSCII